MPHNMDIHFAEFKINRLEKKKKIIEDGPVVTISRAMGCPGFTLAEKIAERIDELKLETEEENSWTIAGKDIITNAANNLNLKESLVDKMHRSKPSIFAGLLDGLNNEYKPSDFKIKKTVAEIVRGLALDGHVIIVGRGGVVLARDIVKSLHIRLTAPINWRVEALVNTGKLNHDEALSRINAVDRERHYVRDFFSGEHFDNETFDITFNCARLTVDEMAATVIALMKEKKFFYSSQ